MQERFLDLIQALAVRVLVPVSLQLEPLVVALVQRASAAVME